MMLINENGESLELARAIPRAWLMHGKRISVSDAPTHFGNIGFSIESNVLKKQITVQIIPPTRKAVPIRLRLRHPEGKPIQSVAIGGQPHEDFGTEWINLPALSEGAVNLTATY